MANFLDANVAQMASSAAGVQDAAAMFRTTLHQAEQTAMQAQAFHQGESSAAFQASHARFVSGASKLNTLLDIAGMNVHEGSQTYIAADAEGADAMNSVPIADGGGISIRA
jgi:uncharacterized protein YukE